MWDYIRNLPSGVYWGKILPLLQDTITVSISDINLQFTTEANRVYYDYYTDLMSEYHVLEDFASHVNSNDIVYDIGANVGIYAVLGSVIAESVHGFEPDPKTTQYLQTNLRQNGGGTVHQYALGNKKQTALLKTKGLTGHTIRKSGNLEIQIYKGDDITSKVDRTPSVVKIDVEGFEGNVIEGFKKTLSDDVRLIYCEIHSDGSKNGPEQIVGRLESLGFEVTFLQERAGEDHIRAEK